MPEEDLTLEDDEPTPDKDRSSLEGAAPGKLEASEKPEPFAVEEDSSHVKTLDVCPNCGAPMRDIETLVCMRCGFDMKAMKIIEVEQGEAEVEDAPEPLVKPDRFDPWLPVTLLAIGAVVLLIGYLAGVRGLFPSVAAEGETVAAITWGERGAALARLPVLLLIWTGCAFAGLIGAAWLFGKPFGDVRTALLRLLGIVFIARTVAFIDLPWPLLTFLAEAGGQIVVFIALSMALFRLKPRDAGTLAGLTVLAFVVLFVTTQLLTWAMQ